MKRVPHLRIALFAHSTNPRGGVVHALAVGDALVRLGLETTVHAPDPRGAGFFRQALCKTVSVATSAYCGDTTAMVEARVADYLRHLVVPAHRRFDVFHAQDGISGNALATLKERGLIRRFARTVHHIDAFADARLAALQERAITAADALFVVSRQVQAELADRFGREATVVGNGVDPLVFSRRPDGREGGLRERLGIKQGPVFLAVGGIEERKNTHRLLQAFVQVQRLRSSAQLVIAGGASLLDHANYQAEFTRQLAASGLPPAAVILTGPLDQADMPALYRIADTLVFPSVKEGFGLVVLEAMASGVPVVTSRIAPFTEYLGEDDVVWCDPASEATIANAMLVSLAPRLRERLALQGLSVAADHGWSRTAEAHLGAYHHLAEFHHA